MSTVDPQSVLKRAATEGVNPDYLTSGGFVGDDLARRLAGGSDSGLQLRQATVTGPSPENGATKIVIGGGGTEYVARCLDSFSPVTGDTVWCVRQGADTLVLGRVSSMAGVIQMFAGDTPPPGWLICNGFTYPRAAYPSLFAAIGTRYGAGDGSTTFQIPDLRGRVAVGFNSGETEFNSLNKKGGAKTHTLSIAEMPTHTHAQSPHSHSQSSHSHSMDTPKWLGTDVADGGTMYSPATTNTQPRVKGRDTNSVTPSIGSTTATNQDAGSGGAHNNLQPYITLNYIIAT